MRFSRRFDIALPGYSNNGMVTEAEVRWGISIRDLVNQGASGTLLGYPRKSCLSPSYGGQSTILYGLRVVHF